MRTHELILYASAQHRTPGAMILHLWFDGEATLQMDVQVALRRPDVAYVEIIDCIQHTTKRIEGRPEMRNRQER
jgi:hypothetical protein